MLTDSDLGIWHRSLSTRSGVSLPQELRPIPNFDLDVTEGIDHVSSVAEGWLRTSWLTMDISYGEG